MCRGAHRILESSYGRDRINGTLVRITIIIIIILLLLFRRGLRRRRRNDIIILYEFPAVKLFTDRPTDGNVTKSRGHEPTTTE